MKICRICNKSKSLDCFNMEKRNNTYRGYCKECGKIISLRNGRTKDGVISRIYGRQKAVSKRRKYSPPEYTKEEFYEWMIKQESFHKLYENWVLNNYNSDFAVSCDRKDDYKTYSFDNIQLMTWRENNNKGNRDIKDGKNNKQAKAVAKYDTNMKLIATYYSANNANRETGINRSNISACCRGNTPLKTAGGFIWKFI